VKLLAFDCGYWTVEASGELYSLFQSLVDAGFEYEWKGRWYPEEDARIQATRQRETLKDSHAYSCVDGVAWFRS